MEIEISRFDLWPRRSPRGYQIGFKIKTRNNYEIYKEQLVDLSEAEGRTDEEIVELAWKKIKDKVIERVLLLECKPNIVGKQWIPPDIDEVEQMRQETLLEQVPEQDDENNEGDGEEGGGDEEEGVVGEEPEEGYEDGTPSGEN